MSANPANRPAPQSALPPSPGESGTAPGCLRITPRNCVGCRTCELACSFSHSVDGVFSRSRIKVHQLGDKRYVQMTCLQCADAACAKVCPVEALALNGATGAIEVFSERCVGCGLCVVACPFGHMHFDPERRVAVKCDLCGGTPKCAQFCPNRALENVR